MNQAMRLFTCFPGNCGINALNINLQRVKTVQNVVRTTYHSTEIAHQVSNLFVYIKDGAIHLTINYS